MLGKMLKQLLPRTSDRNVKALIDALQEEEVPTTTLFKNVLFPPHIPFRKFWQRFGQFFVQFGH